MKPLAIILVAVIASNIPVCQAQNHYGKEFYFGMPHNYPSQCQEISLDIASLKTGIYNLTVPFLNIVNNGIINTNLTKLKLPCNITKPGTFKDARGIHLKASIEIALYATNYYKDTAESFLVLPVEQLGKSYSTAGYVPYTSSEESYIMVTASETDTHVSIYKQDTRKFLHNFTMNELELSQFSTADDLQDLTVLADKPVSVITGTSCVNIPIGVTACDVIFEQMIPSESLDNIYIVPPTPPKLAYELRVTSLKKSQNKTVCFYNQTKRFCASDSTITIRMGNTPTVVVSDDPCAVFQYGFGNGYPQTKVGDPFMTVIPGLGQFLNLYYFVIPNVYKNAKNHISVIIETNSTEGLIFDGSNLTKANSFNVSKPLRNYSVLILTVQSGFHIVRHVNPNVKFGLLIYGFGTKSNTFVGFGYPGGMQLHSYETSSITSTSVPDTSTLNNNGTDSFTYGMTVSSVSDISITTINQTASDIFSVTISSIPNNSMTTSKRADAGNTARSTSHVPASNNSVSTSIDYSMPSTPTISVNGDLNVNISKITTAASQTFSNQSAKDDTTTTHENRPTRMNMDTGPTDQWFRNFYRRHPELSERTAENMDAGRTRMSNSVTMAKWFSFLGKVLEENGLKDYPERIYNCDETGWSGKESGKTKVVGRKGGHTFKQKIGVSGHITAHLCVCADGRFLPTMLIFQGSLPHRDYKDGLPSSWLYATTDSGYMDGDLFVSWFRQCFLKHCGKERPVCLIMDNHDAHITLPLVEAAQANDVILVGLPGHTTHILQPLDVKIIGPLKTRCTTIAERCGFLSNSFNISKSRFPLLLSYAIDQTTPSSVKEAFRVTGICPLNEAAIDQSQIVPASFEKKTTTDDNQSKEGPKTCATCGSFATNPLVQQGLVPQHLADVLMPTPIKPVSGQRKRRVVSEGRVISGEGMLEQLKEREAASVAKKERQEERKRKRQMKEESADKKRKGKKVAKSGEKHTDCSSEKIEGKREAVLTVSTRANGLASVVYTCGVRGRNDDEANGIEWVGCDEEMCLAWFHLDCLTDCEKEYVNESLMEGTSWFCKMCKPWLYEEE